MLHPARFSDNGSGLNVQHYIAPWLCTTYEKEDSEHQNSLPNKDIFLRGAIVDKLLTLHLTSRQDYQRFFSDYQDSFRGDLVHLLFDIVFEVIATNEGNNTSETLMIDLMKDISDSISIIGSPLRTLITEARLICFVLKVAFEIATEGSFVASKVKGSQSLLHQIMSIRECQWEEVFFLNIIRICGLAGMVAWMRQGAFNSLSWAEKWQKGMVSNRESIEENLRNSEKELLEAEKEEQRKCQEFRRCVK